MSELHNLDEAVRDIVVDEVRDYLGDRLEALERHHPAYLEGMATMGERLDAHDARIAELELAHDNEEHARRHGLEGELRALRDADEESPSEAPPTAYAPSEELERVRARNARAESALATSSYNIVSIDAAHEAVVDLCVDLIMYLPEYRRVMALDSVRMHVNAGDSETL